MNKEERIKMDKEERIKILKDSYRMFHIENDDNGVNRTLGLFMLAEEIMKTDFIVAEIGSFCGVSSEVLALHCKKIYYFIKKKIRIFCIISSYEFSIIL